jgi:ribosome-binding protein aMBF1 (putative translation factor)
MSNLASTLRDEISRLARKEIRQQVDPLKKSNAQLRRTVASLKGELAELQRTMRFLQTREKRRLEAPSQPDESKAVRFSPNWLKADRRRLGLSAEDYGRLVGVSSVTVYSWESGKSKPSAQRLAAWAEVRGIGKREARQRLELLSDGEPSNAS